jgi:hypothetical protein
MPNSLIIKKYLNKACPQRYRHIPRKVELRVNDKFTVKYDSSQCETYSDAEIFNSKVENIIKHLSKALDLEIIEKWNEKDEGE